MLSKKIEEKIIGEIKSLGLDMIEEAGSGHPGIVLGAAPILYTLYLNHLRFDASNPNFYNRDRFIMSAGHGSSLLYSILYFAGYDLSLDDLKAFRRLNSKTPGHPEYKKTPGVEMTTGPLGQGFATAVGYAIAEKHTEALINKNEKVIENNANIFDYNDNAKLKVTGFSPMNDPLIPLLNDKGEEQKDKEGNVIMTKNPARMQEDDAILNAKVFYTPDKDGDIDWIIKDINDTASENHKKTCLDMALMIAGVPNVTDQGFTNADNAAALEKKFFPLEQVLQQAHHLFRKEYLRMWEMLTARINLKKGKEYDFRDIDVILIRNLPTDTESLTTAWLKLRGLVSDKSIISQYLHLQKYNEIENNNLEELNYKLSPYFFYIIFIDYKIIIKLFGIRIVIKNKECFNKIIVISFSNFLRRLFSINTKKIEGKKITFLNLLGLKFKLEGK